MPSLASSASPASDWTTNTSPKNASVTASAGNLILVFGGTEGSGTTLNTPSDGTNTYTAVTSSAVSGYSAGYAWTAGIIGQLAVTTTSLPGATSGVAYTTTLAASGGTGSGQAWTVIAGALPGWASLSAGRVISGTPDSTTGTFSFTVQVTDSGSNTATQPLSITVSSASLQPVGPGGTWTLKFDDQFPGSSLDTTKWATPNGITNSATTTNSAQVSVSGGSCNILHSGMINSQPSLQGWGANPSPGVTLNVGDCCEASINFPGPSGDATYNWPAWWVSGASWPANGEEDIFEGYNGTPSALNYHNSGGANNGPFPSGSWCNSFHTYTLVRGSTTLSCYWDGALVRQITRSDSGGPQSLIVFAAGDGSSGGPLNTSLPIQVDYVRVWSPG